MESFEDKTHAFIVRIWLERREMKGADAVWRGVVEHIPTDGQQQGERRYIRDLDEITAYITPFLEEMGVRLGTRRRA
jgi:hypothetical protein